MKTKLYLIIFLFLAFVQNIYGQGVWFQKANFGGGIRFAAVGFAIGAKGYIGTGLDSIANSYTKDFWEYDPVTDTWTQKADFGGSARCKAIGFAIGTKGYIGTGDAKPGGYSKDFWEYDPISNSWSRKTDFGGAGREYAAGFTIGTKGYIGTGGESTLVSYNDFWEYDQITDTWTKMADFAGIKRVWATGFAISKKGYLGTGHNSSYLSDFWEYDPSTNTWTKKADFPIGVEWATSFVIGSKGYIGTGSAGGYLNYLAEYDPSNNTWTKKADFGGTYRNVSVGFAIGTKGYIGTGHDPSLRDDFWEYTPDCSAHFYIYPDTIPHNWIAVNQAVGSTPISYLWHWGDGDSSTGANPSHIYNTPGYYNICLTIKDSGGCTNTYCDSSTYLYRSSFDNTMITVNVMDVITFLEKSNENMITVYPNPLTSFSIIQFSNNINGGQVIFYDMLGKEMMSKKFTGNKVEIEKGNLESGVYFVKMRYNEREYIQKLVVE